LLLLPELPIGEAGANGHCDPGEQLGNRFPKFVFEVSVILGV